MKGSLLVAVGLATFLARTPRARADYELTLIGENTSLAPSGAAIKLEGTGRFNPLVETVKAGGTFTQYDSDGTALRRGTWKTVTFVRFQRFPGPEGRALGGVLDVVASFVSDGRLEQLPMRFVSGVNKPATFGDEEGTAVGPFTEKSGGTVRFEPR
jgi:hypothetical protein